MTLEQYKLKKVRIDKLKLLSNHEKQVLKRDLWLEYIAVDRSGLNHFDSAKLKPVFQLLLLNN